MKNIGRKIMTGTIAASLLFGGAAFVHNSAYAADKTVTTDSQQAGKAQGGMKDRGGSRQEGGMQGGGNFRGGGSSVFKEVATLLGSDEKTIMESLQSGKTLVEIAQAAGITEDVLLEKLTASETQTIDAAVSSGKMTQEQADKLKSGLAERLKQQVENTKQQGAGGQMKDGKGPSGQQKDGKGPGPGMPGMGMLGGPKEMAELTGITEDELKTGFEAGKSLAEIAAEKGITRDQLISTLQASLTEQLGKMVDQKHQAPPAPPTEAAPQS
ncbi:hypothetical protein [Paenibacillus thalictri]|uniref:LysM domain-containing protein n=1 Tax=Paenibacillus thalictri TaxID=2527873 RepID=A0A4Q9DZA5_9BACL|nr:hypothetical protein [Paenibacillus thalictri]TBL80601.1 hypothetical protein EYB31_05065 [Paenibacillus thalictri]